MKLRTRNYDVTGMSCGRTLRQHVFGKFRPLWSFSGDLELRHLMALAARHYIGYPIAYLTTRYNAQWQRLLSGWRRRFAASDESVK